MWLGYDSIRLIWLIWLVWLIWWVLGTLNFNSKLSLCNSPTQCFALDVPITWALVDCRLSASDLNPRWWPCAASWAQSKPPVQWNDTEPQNAPKQRKWFPPSGAKQMQRDRRVKSEEIYIYILLYYYYHYICYFDLFCYWNRLAEAARPDDTWYCRDQPQHCSANKWRHGKYASRLPSRACFNTKTETVQESWV